ncbi:hypothetical protein JXB41_03835 [Candidatus Woesearchaeota archaeon]|nr:hypothetical protein [Candidatus Woesearchaeota archaeon]
MQCDICKKNYLFLHFVGKDNVCNNCIAKYTVFKEIKTTSEARLKKALRAFDINSFEDLKNIKEHQLEKLENQALPKKAKVTYKTNRLPKRNMLLSEDAQDPMSEMDQFW